MNELISDSKGTCAASSAASDDRPDAGSALARDAEQDAAASAEIVDTQDTILVRIDLSRIQGQENDLLSWSMLNQRDIKRTKYNTVL